MHVTSFEAFRLHSLMEGFDEVLECRFEPLTLVEMRAEAFATKAVLRSGEMWLTVGDLTRQLRPGDAFEIERDVPHAERYGTEDVLCWVARRHG